MFEQAPQPPNPEKNNYDEFYDALRQFDKECERGHRPLSSYDYVYGSLNTPIEAEFGRRGQIYRLRVTGNKGAIPVQLIGLSDEQMNIHHIEFRMDERRMFIFGRLKDSKQHELDGWDHEISSLKPDTRSLLRLLPLTIPRRRLIKS